MKTNQQGQKKQRKQKERVAAKLKNKSYVLARRQPAIKLNE